MMAGWYCTLEQAENALKAEATTNAVEVNRLKSAIITVTHRVNEVMGATRPIFLPYLREHKFPLRESRLMENGTVFNLDMPLQSLSAATYTYPELSTPSDIVSRLSVDDGRLIADTSGYFWSLYRTYGRSVRLNITGVWVWHNDYDEAWAEATLLNGGINATQSTIIVDASDVKDPNNIFRAFSAGSFIRVDDEWMIVTDYDDTTNTLTIQRGVNGSTAATHADNSPVEIFQIEATIAHVVARQASLIYNRAGAYATTTVDGFGVTTYPQDLLPELLRTLNNFQMRG